MCLSLPNCFGFKDHRVGAVSVCGIGVWGWCMKRDMSTRRFRDGKVVEENGFCGCDMGVDIGIWYGVGIVTHV